MAFEPTGVMLFSSPTDFGAPAERPFDVVRYESDGVVIRTNDKETKLLYADAMDGFLTLEDPPTP